MPARQEGKRERESVCEREGGNEGGREGGKSGVAEFQCADGAEQPTDDAVCTVRGSEESRESPASDD